MPELPEVETIRRDLSQRIIGKTIKSVEIIKPKLVKTDHTQFVSYLPGKSIETVERIGKLLMLKVGELYLLVHLKMTGQLIYSEANDFVAGGHPYPELDKTNLENKWTGVKLIFTDNTKLIFNDQRLFGYFNLVDKSTRDKAMARFGIEPLTKAFTWDNFYPLFKKRTAPLKNFLLNQQLVAGLGNIYVDEVCHQAKVQPQRRLNTLTQTEIKALFEAIEHIISLAIEKRGTTFKDYRDAYGKTGNFANSLQVYGRGGQACNQCGTALIKTKIAGRGTVYCQKCQK